MFALNTLAACPAISQNAISITLFKIRSVSKHSIDIMHDARITKSDAIFLTETQLLPHHPDNDIKSTLTPFQLHRQDHPTNKFSSLAVCTKPSIRFTNTLYLPTINAWIFEILQTKSNKSLTFLLLYRKNGSHRQQYIENLSNILESNNVHIILGDFNIDYLADSILDRVISPLEYIQIVDKPMFVSGSLIDQIFVKHSLSTYITKEIISIYYSDHDSVQIVFLLEELESLLNDIP